MSPIKNTKLDLIRKKSTDGIRSIETTKPHSRIQISVPVSQKVKSKNPSLKLNAHPVKSPTNLMFMHSQQKSLQSAVTLMQHQAKVSLTKSPFK